MSTFFAVFFSATYKTTYITEYTLHMEDKYWEQYDHNLDSVTISMLNNNIEYN